MKIVGYAICGSNQPHLESTLKSLSLADEVVICGNNIGTKEKKLIEKHGYDFVSDNREWGKYQNIIKEDFLKEVVALYKPDGCICLDTDEEFDEKLTRDELERYLHDYWGLYFYFIQHWNAPDKHNPRLNFWNVRAFKWTGETYFENRPLHPGLAPKFAYMYGSYVPHFVRHYGLMDKTKRKQKYERYKMYDPHEKYLKGWYNNLISNEKGERFDADEWRQKLIAEVESYGSQLKTYRPMKNKEVVYFRFSKRDPQTGEVIRSWIVDQPAELEGDVLKQNSQNLKVEKLSTQPAKTKGESVETTTAPDPEPELEESEPNVCSVCGFVAKNQAGLSRHAKKHA